MRKLLLSPAFVLKYFILCFDKISLLEVIQQNFAFREIQFLWRNNNASLF